MSGLSAIQSQTGLAFLRREAQKESVARQVPPRRDCSRETVVMVNEFIYRLKNKGSSVVIHFPCHYLWSLRVTAHLATTKPNNWQWWRVFPHLLLSCHVVLNLWYHSAHGKEYSKMTCWLVIRLEALGLMLAGVQLFYIAWGWKNNVFSTLCKTLVWHMMKQCLLWKSISFRKLM